MDLDLEVYPTSFLPSYNQVSSMVTRSALAWSLISDGGGDLSSGTSTFTDKELLQLKGLFQSLDHNRDGKLDESQVRQAFDLLGIKPSADTASVFSELQLADFPAFVEGLNAEKHRLQEFGGQLDLLLSFYDTSNTGYVSRRDLEQLLCSQSSPFCFSKKDFESFMNTLEPKNQHRIGTEWIKQRLLFSG